MRGTRARAMSSPSVEFLTGWACSSHLAGTEMLGDLTLGQFMGFMTSALLLYSR